MSWTAASSSSSSSSVPDASLSLPYRVHPPGAAQVQGELGDLKQYNHATNSYPNEPLDPFTDALPSSPLSSDGGGAGYARTTSTTTTTTATTSLNNNRADPIDPFAPLSYVPSQTLARTTTSISSSTTTTASSSLQPVSNPTITVSSTVYPELQKPLESSALSPTFISDPFGPAVPVAAASAYSAASAPMAPAAPVPLAVVPYAEGDPKVYVAAPLPLKDDVALAGGPARKVLIILSGEDHLDLVSGKPKETGFFLSELAIPFFALKAQGYQVVFANPNGAMPHCDPMSNSKYWFGIGESAQFERAKVVLREEPTFMHPVPLYTLDETALNQFRGVFIPGGHAPMQDLIRHLEVGRVLTHFHNKRKPTGAICHGQAALLAARRADNSWLYAGYTMCCYSNSEEWMIEKLWRDQVPIKLETALRQAGAIMEQDWPMASRVVEDRELVTGQNPRSAEKFASYFVAKLDRYPEVIPLDQAQQQQQLHMYGQHQSASIAPSAPPSAAVPLSAAGGGAHPTVA